MNDLFRSEAVKFQAARLEGEVLLAVRLRWLLLGFLCSGAVALIIVAALFTTYTRKVDASGLVVTNKPLITVVADRHSVVEDILVSEGQHVEAGKKLVVIKQNTIKSAWIDRTEGKSVNCLEENEVNTENLKSEENNSCTLMSPANAVVGLLSLHRGQELLLGQNIIKLIPVDAEMEVELLIPASAIGFVKPNLEVSIRYKSFSYQKFGESRGKILSIAPLPEDSIQNALKPVPVEPLYRARVALEKNYIDAYGEQIPLRYGMQLDAKIYLGKQSLFEWLFDSRYALSEKN